MAKNKPVPLPSEPNPATEPFPTTIETIPPKTYGISAIGGHVVVRPHEPETMTQGGLILPQSADRTTTHGVVLAVGSGRDAHGPLATFQLVPGDTIYWVSFGGHRLEIDGEQLIALREDDIICKVVK